MSKTPTFSEARARFVAMDQAAHEAQESKKSLEGPQAMKATNEAVPEEQAGETKVERFFREYALRTASNKEDPRPPFVPAPVPMPVPQPERRSHLESGISPKKDPARNVASDVLGELLKKRSAELASVCEDEPLLVEEERPPFWPLRPVNRHAFPLTSRSRYLPRKDPPAPPPSPEPQVSYET